MAQQQRFEQEVISTYLTNEEMEDFLKKCKHAVYGDLECRNCQQYCHPPFTACEGTHLICDDCCDSCEVCQICGTRNGEIHLQFLEKVHSLLEFPCENHLRGCDYQGVSETLIKHEEVCTYSVFQCLDPTCDWQGSSKDIFPHYRENHPSKLEIPNHLIDRIETQGNMIITNVVKKFGHLFMIRIVYSPVERCLHLIATNYEPFREVEEYCLLIDLVLKDGSTYTANVMFEFCSNKVEILDLSNKIPYGTTGRESEQIVAYRNIRIESVHQYSENESFSSEEDSEYEDSENEESEDEHSV